MQSTNRQKKSGEANSSGKLRIFYVLMLLLMIFSLFARVSGLGRGRAAGQASGGTGTTARVLVFHHKDGSECKDLAITATGSVVVSNCGSGKEKEYILSNSERSQLQSWIDQYSPVNYDYSDPAQPGVSTQLYLNGRGNQQASDVVTSQIIGFAESWALKIVLQP